MENIKKSCDIEIPICTNKCSSCKYSCKCGRDENNKGVGWCCTYILIEKKSRGCPAGDECDKYIEATAINKQEEHRGRWRHYDKTYNKD